MRPWAKFYVLNSRSQFQPFACSTLGVAETFQRLRGGQIVPAKFDYLGNI